MCLGGVGFARSFEFSFSLGSRLRDGGALRLIYDNGSGAASPAAEDNFFFFSPTRRERKLCGRGVSGERQQQRHQWVRGGHSSGKKLLWPPRWERQLCILDSIIFKIYRPLLMSTMYRHRGTMITSSFHSTRPRPPPLRSCWQKIHLVNLNSWRHYITIIPVAPETTLQTP